MQYITLEKAWEILESINVSSLTLNAFELYLMGGSLEEYATNKEYELEFWECISYVEEKFGITTLVKKIVQLEQQRQFYYYPKYKEFYYKDYIPAEVISICNDKVKEITSEIEVIEKKIKNNRKLIELEIEDKLWDHLGQMNKSKK